MPGGGTRPSPLRAEDPTVPLTDFQFLEDAVAESVAQERFLSRLVTVFALLGLALSASGVYAVVSFAVGRRTREIGIRRAVGAGVASVGSLVARWSLGRVGLGIALGLGASVWLGRLVETFMFETGAMDPPVLGLVSILVAAIGVAATVMPTLRALEVDPVVALRAE